MEGDNFKEYWCPFGRISMQQIRTDGSTHALPAGAFNIAVVASNKGSDSIYHSSRCIGAVCPFFVPPKKRGKNGSICRAAKDPNKHILLAACMITFAVLCVGAFLGWILLSKI